MRKLKHQPKKVGGWLWRKLPWYGKILVPFVVIAAILYLAEGVGAFFGWS